MPLCEMCGSNTNRLYKTSLEGTDLNVCKTCSSYGKVKEIIHTKIKERKSTKQDRIIEEPKTEIIQLITNNYSQLIKNAREKKKLKQKEVARLLNEKESVIHKIESGSFRPSIKLAEKFERFFRINLIEEHEEIHTQKKDTTTSEGFTLGDMMKKRKQ